MWTFFGLRFYQYFLCHFGFQTQFTQTPVFKHQFTLTLTLTTLAQMSGTTDTLPFHWVTLSTVKKIYGTLFCPCGQIGLLHANNASHIMDTPKNNIACSFPNDMLQYVLSSCSPYIAEETCFSEYLMKKRISLNLYFLFEYMYLERQSRLKLIFHST